MEVRLSALRAGRALLPRKIIELIPNANALLWFSKFVKYLVFHFFVSLRTMIICRSSCILWLFIYQDACRMDRRVLDWKRWRISMLNLGAVPHSWIEFRKSIWVWVLLCIGGVCFLLIVLIFRVASSFFHFRFSFFFIWCALPTSVFYRVACPGISLHFSAVDQHCPFALSDKFHCLGWIFFDLF
jgi:hypothetical protein